MGCEWVGWRTVSALVEIKHETIRVISHVQVQQEDRTEESERQLREELARQMRLEHQDAAAAIAEEVAGIKVLHVVAAAIFNKRGELLITQRPLDKHMGGLWEFPGGKMEAGEAVTDVLCRELDEELGIQTLSWESLICIEHAYPEKTVLLDVWIVRDFGGEAHSREGQAVQWVAPNRLDQFEFPEANRGIIEALNI